MGHYLESEKRRLTAWKQTTPALTAAARQPGTYKGRPRDFCLPQANAVENLFPAIRTTAPAYFDAFDIKWHDGIRSTCSNHLCDSMVSCVNVLFPLADKPEALGALLRPLFPCLKRVVPMEDSGYSLAIEWVGLHNYLGEIVRGERPRTRGANFTSLDAAVRFEDQCGHTQIALIEWKYTESYGRTSKATGTSGARRLTIYRDLYADPDGPIDTAKAPAYEALFYEPFYQMLRQQLLADQMERHHELGADIVTVVHVSPQQNHDLRRITSPDLVSLGESATAVWRSLLRRPTRFIDVHTEGLFAAIDSAAHPDLAEWHAYISDRYGF